VQKTIEAFNTAEVLDYFHSDCLLPRNWMELSDVAGNTAVIYPIVLPDRLVILTAIGGELYQHIADVPEALLREVVLEFRESIEDLGSAKEDYQGPGEELYDWIMLPILDELRGSGIETLVFVPAAMFRSIPMSALYDGKEYLIQNFKIATTLGLNLTDPASLRIDRAQLLLGGISDAVPGYEALPGVAQELTEISSIMGGDKFLNEEFSLGEVSKKLAVGGYSIVHFATHGVFADQYTDSYLLTYDGKLTLGRLQNTVGKRRYLDKPLELMVLSACETAVGNDKAALGLAGVALKAGAKAAIASLWLISDEGTTRLMTQFYKELAEGKTKAEALQAAQLDLVSDQVYSHPNFWSPFLLVGNWL
jgi:CHAT domain-containing protein